MGIDGDSMLLDSLVLLSFDLFYIRQDTHDVYVPLSTYLSSIVVVYTWHLLLYLSQVSSKVGLGESEKKESQYEGRKKKYVTTSGAEYPKDTSNIRERTLTQ